jgi:hypothetical protein
VPVAKGLFEDAQLFGVLKVDHDDSHLDVDVDFTIEAINTTELLN